VTWTWAGDSVHNVTFQDGNGTSPDQSTGTFQRTFPVAGVFAYSCTLHQGMVGIVTVQ
jgi:plastocyanin